MAKRCTGVNKVNCGRRPIWRLLPKSGSSSIPLGFDLLRVPTADEWDAERLSWSSNNRAGAFASSLKLAAAGYRDLSNGSLISAGATGFYWSGTVLNGNTYSIAFASATSFLNDYSRAWGRSVRLILNGTFTPGQYESTYEGNTIQLHGLTYGFCYNTTTERIWLDRNIGATQVATAFDDEDAYGWLYQWGRGTDGHQVITSGTSATLSDTDQPGHGDFIITSGSPNDWRDPQNDNLWQGVNGINNPKF